MPGSECLNADAELLFDAVREAGGIAGDLDGQSYIYNRPVTWQHGMIAAGAKRHAVIAKALRTP